MFLNNPGGARAVQIIVSINISPYNNLEQSGSRSGAQESFRLKFVQIFPNTIIRVVPERFRLLQVFPHTIIRGRAVPGAVPGTVPGSRSDDCIYKYFPIQ